MIERDLSSNKECRANQGIWYFSHRHGGRLREACQWECAKQTKILWEYSDSFIKYYYRNTQHVYALATHRYSVPWPSYKYTYISSMLVLGMHTHTYAYTWQNKYTYMYMHVHAHAYFPISIYMYIHITNLSGFDGVTLFIRFVAKDDFFVHKGPGALVFHWLESILSTHTHASTSASKRCQIGSWWTN